MFLKEKANGHLVEVVDLQALFNPHGAALEVRSHYGEELQDAESLTKAALVFPSGEPLPACWCDPHYRDADLARHRPH